MDQDDSNLCVGSLAGIRQLSETNYIQGDAGHDELVACNKWDYDTSQFQNTIIENWDLVCGNKIMSKISSFVFFAGTGVGVFLAGILADKIGRTVPSVSSSPCSYRPALRAHSRHPSSCG